MKDDRDWILERLGADETPATPPPAAPSLPSPSHLRDGFIERATANSAQVVSLPTLEELPHAVADYLRRNDLPATAVCEDSLFALPWRQAALAVEARAPNARTFAASPASRWRRRTPAPCCRPTKWRMR